jgi:hypothetical protein
LKNGFVNDKQTVKPGQAVRTEMKIYGFLLLTGILAWIPLQAQVNKPLIEVNSSVDTAVITIGDRITYTLTIEHKSGMRVEQPGAGVNLGQFEIKDYKIFEPVKKGDYLFLKYEYVISVFDTGTFTIPPFPVAYFPADSMGAYKIIEASPVNIYVRSVITDDQRELRDIRPPVSIPFDYVFLFSMLAVVILLVLAGYFGYILYKRRKEKGFLFRAPEPPRPAHEVALQAIDLLLKRNLLEQGAHKEFYSELSEIIRRYIEGRYFVPALEETSYEILQEIREQDIADELVRLLDEFLTISDLVKFARYIPDQQENEKVVEQAVRFVEDTKVVLAAPESEIREAGVVMPVAGDSGKGVPPAAEE